jgi:hypothetical protein
MSKHLPLPSFGLPTLAALGAAAVAACAGAGSTSTSTSTSSQVTAALDVAQCTFLADRAAAQACEQAFATCVAQAGADLAACRATLKACLPPPPDGGFPDGDHHGGPFGPPPPFADGGVGLGSPGDGDGHGHDRGPGPGPGCDGADGGQPGAPAVALPNVAAVTACHDALQACLTATPGAVTCFQTERSCEQAAFAAAFAAACAAAQPCTAGDPACAELQARCQEGVDGRPGAFDGGSCP